MLLSMSNDPVVSIRLLDWVERDSKRSKFDRIVILKNMFDVKEFEVNLECGLLQAFLQPYFVIVLNRASLIKTFRTPSNT